MLREKINCLEDECSAYLSPMGWLGIYSICFSQLDGGKDPFPLDWVFYGLIAIGLIRDNEGAVIEDYSTPHIGEIRFDLQDKLLLGIILTPLPVRFSLIYGTWTFQIVQAICPWGARARLPFWTGARSPGVSPGLLFPWAW